jgi:tRNA pseudouridine38-40 synthase
VPRTLKITIAYDGSEYAGWQRQINAHSIQAAIEDELAVILGAHHAIVAAGRTDSGVHAAAQVASVTIDHPIPLDELLRALNGRLKAGDIRIRAIDETFDGFDARVFAKTKTYRYAIWNGPAPNPFIRHVVWHVPQPLDLDRMVAATPALIGEHDFAAFQGSGSDVKTTVRRMLAAELVEVDINTDQPVALPVLESNGDRSNGRLLRFEITGTGFLRHMVRTIAGTLVDIGRGNMEVEDIALAISSRERARTGQTAPAQGLMLWTVTY